MNFSVLTHKVSGSYEERDIGNIKSIYDFEISGKGKIILKLSTNNVKNDGD